MKVINAIGHFLLDLLETIVIALVVFAIFYIWIAQPHQVRGDSMYPTLQTGEYILTNKLAMRFDTIERGEIIVFKYPESPTTDYIKRVVALPGEELLLQNGNVYIFNEDNPNGVLLDEPYLPGGMVTEGRVTIQEGRRFQLAKDEYAVFGDNRDRSSDSRQWGPVKEDLIIGKSWIRYWPPQSFAFMNENADD